MRRAALLAVATFLALAGVLLVGAPASAHVVPSSVVELDVHERSITAHLSLPSSDLAIASGIDLPRSGAADAAVADRIAAYVQQHFRVRSGSEQWKVAVASDAAVATTEQWGTGLFPAVDLTATLTPPSTSTLRSFTLDYDVIVHQVVTADTFVVLHSDWSTGQLGSGRTLGAIVTDTVTGQVSPLPIRLDDGSAWQGFTGMVGLGIGHIAEGTDHQLFLLTLLLPAPLLAVGRRWSRTASARRTVRRITAITLAFTVGHSITLALGTLGLPVPQQAVEAAIAASILVAALHAARPLFPGREPLVAGLFGLVHGMAFSTVLAALDLSGGQLALSLLGFNLGIELMQLVVVLAVLPPLIVLARTSAYRVLRISAAGVTAIAAVGWLLDRVGLLNPVAMLADGIGATSPWIAIGLWGAAVAVLLSRRIRGGRPMASEEPSAARSTSRPSGVLLDRV